MSEPIEPIRHKLAEAVPPSPAPEDADHPDLKRDHDQLMPGMKEHNADVQPGHQERLVGIGRGHDTSGRGSQKGSE